MIKTIFVVILILFALSFFNINVRSVVESDIFQKNLEFVENALSKIWEWFVPFWGKYLAGPASTLWNIFLDGLNKIKSGEIMQEVQDSVPTTPEVN